MLLGERGGARIIERLVLTCQSVYGMLVASVDVPGKLGGPAIAKGRRLVGCEELRHRFFEGWRSLLTESPVAGESVVAVGVFPHYASAA